MSSKIKIVIILILLTILAYLGIQKWYPTSSTPTNNDTGAVACTEEAKICPDGTAVGRQGPNCEFAACPTATTPIQSGRKVFADTANNLTFQYPAALPTTYITTQDRPPTISLLDGKINCKSLPLHTLSDREYCVQSTSEWAAGSIYITNIYSTFLADHNKTVSLTSTIRAVQCVNYDEPKASECTQERETFDLDIIMDTIVRSITFNK